MPRLYIPRRFFHRLAEKVQTRYEARKSEENKQEIFKKRKDFIAIVISSIAALISFSALVVAYKNFQTASISLRISNKAYVLVDSVKTPKIPINDPIDYMKISVSFKNFGKTPAQNVQVRVQVDTCTQLPPGTLIFKKLEGIPSIGVIAPDKDIWSITRKKFGQKTIDRIIEGKSIVYIFGTVVYSDIFNESNTTKFCYIYNAILNRYDIHSKHNEIYQNVKP